MTKENNKSSIISVDFKEALSERYLSYALSTIMSRSLPDVRDGLKPVHRRLIYAMYALRLNPHTAHKKCARVVGDVMGKFHPHGDSSIYGALVRLAQDFSLRYPLIDGQGNFGNIDGDNAAAMRYTEARLSPIALYLLDGLEENGVDLKETYDGEESEPIVMPSAFPNLLANGSTGIAVGMSTSIPPHNLDELCEALIALVDQPSLETADLMAFVPAPDFPTGGVLCENAQTLRTIYESGRGTVRLRASYTKEERKGGGYAVIVHQIPYMVEKSKLIEKIATLLNDKRLPLLEDVMDESTEEVRVVLIPKSRNVDVITFMEMLYKQTDLEVRVPINLNALDRHNVPRVMSLKEMLWAFLEHRQEVNTRRAQFRVTRIDERLEILSGYLTAYLNLDEVIRIIREEDEPKICLMQQFNLSETQAEAILNMRLRSLRKLQEIEIRQEYEALGLERSELEELLSQPKKMWSKIKKELRDLQKKFGKSTTLGARRTVIADAPAAVILNFEEAITPEDITIVCSSKYWIRSVKGHEETDFKYKEGDTQRFVLRANTLDKLILISSSGRAFTVSSDKIPRSRGAGESLRHLVDLAGGDDIVSVLLVRPGTGQKFLALSSGSRGFVVMGDELIAQTRVGRVLMNLDEKEQTLKVLPCTGDHIAVIGQNRKLLVFPVADMPVMSRGRGVSLQKYKDGAVSDVILFKFEEGLQFNNKGRLYTVKDLRPWLGKRAGSGRLAPMGFSMKNTFSS